MFKGLGNLAQLGSLLKQAQQMGGKLQQLHAELKAKRAEGIAGGGMVKIEVNGAGEVLRCQIDPSLITGGDRELVEDLIPAAANDALAKAKQLHAEAMQSMTAGFDMPGLADMMNQLTGDGGGQPSA